MPSLAKYRKWLFNWHARGIVRTAPVACNPASKLLVLSQTHDPDISMFLIAAKSFTRFITPKAFVVVDDGLNVKNRALLRDHLGEVRFVRSTDVDVGLCPRRGCWERLVTISRLCSDHYVVQLDSDTVTVREPIEVAECLRTNRSFTLGTRLGQACISLGEAGKLAESLGGDHVQVVAESALATLPDAARRRYIRGCAGFAGFSPGAMSFEKLERFSQQMEERIGEAKWREWGSEQVTSNYMIANTENPLVLPFERYPYWDLKQDLSKVSLVHFIGGHRFYGQAYSRHARRIIATLDHTRLK